MFLYLSQMSISCEHIIIFLYLNKGSHTSLSIKKQFDEITNNFDISDKISKINNLIEF